MLPDARLSWKTHGTLSPARDNVVLYPTSYGAQHPDLEWLIGPDGVLDPTRWFIVIPEHVRQWVVVVAVRTRRPSPTLVTIRDNVQAQRRLLREVFGVERLACVYGWSMGALQAYHWAALFPDAVDRIVVNCGSARTAVHNRVFLLGLMAVLEAAPEYLGDGRFTARAARRHARLRPHLRRLGAEPGFLPRRPAPGIRRARRARPRHLPAHGLGGALRRPPPPTCYAQLRTWDAADISANALYGGDLARRCGRSRRACC